MCPYECHILLTNVEIYYIPRATVLISGGSAGCWTVVAGSVAKLRDFGRILLYDP